MPLLAARHATVAPVAAPPRRVFRPEIQALRAVAVSGVVIYHLWPAALPGGFAGVDVFFVISGFLITQQLADEAAATGRIRLGQFWARRIRRILPAALTVLAACLAGVVLLLPRVAWQPNLGDITAAAVYGENWQLAARAVDYLAAEASPSVVQHYWSLSVEEQFYLVWPLLLLVALVAARRLPAVPARRWQLAALAAAGLGSLALSVAWTRADPATAFFATPTRAWEFAAGAGAAATLPRPRSRRAHLLRRAASGTGFVVVLLSMILLTGDDPFPGVIALVPVAGATLVVVTELPAAGRGTVARVTGTRPVQWVGRVSYSLYLWHWPLVVLLPWVVHHELTNADRLGVLVAALALAGATTWAVEDPIRTAAFWRSRTWATYLIPVVGVTCLVAATGAVAGRARTDEAGTVTAQRDEAARQARALVADPPKASRSAPRPRSCYGAAAMDRSNRCAHPYARPAGLDTAFAASDGQDEPCLQPADASTPTYCLLGRTQRPVRTVAVVGNSHAWRLVPALTLYAEEHGWQVVVAARIDCLGLMTTAVSADGASPSCLTWSAAVQRHLLGLPHLDAVIFAGYSFTDKFTVGRSPTAGEQRGRQQQVLALWSALTRHGSRVIVTDDAPGMRPTAAPDCIARSGDTDDPCAIDRSAVVTANPITDLADAHPELAVHAHLTQYFCDAARCHALIGGVVVYFDSHHLTTSYARSLARYLGAAVEAAMNRAPPAR